MRFFYPALSHLGADGDAGRSSRGVDWPQLVLVLCMVTMTLGNLTALSQRNLKRLLAYSSIAHAGYMLMGFVVLSDEGLRAMLFYLVVYYLMNIGAFLVVMIVANSTGREDIDGFRGLAWRGGAAPAVAMAIFLFSLTGLPPLAGFVGKFYLFAAVVRAAVLRPGARRRASTASSRSTTTPASCARCSSTSPTAARPRSRSSLHNGALMWAWPPPPSSSASTGRR